MITNEDQALKLEQYYDRGILKKEIRSYEVSLWTLQDEFITVLKWSDVEQKGRIQNPKMILNIDGLKELNFSIPMYIYINGEISENPNWYSTRNGNLMESLRKIKVIFNKATAIERVFEFMIVNISEEHNNGILTCNIKCENLAFHELGKIGYKINLSQTDFENEYNDWLDTQTGLEPIESLDWWCKACGLQIRSVDNNSPRKWYYSVQMNWKSYEDGTTRDPSKIYEETFVTAWNANLQPTSYCSFKEKERPMKIENSNLYNITQQMAETFGVFCRYEYDYDENYHIVGRNIIFYNTFMAEENKVISIIYPYNSSNIKRVSDNSTITTKLFVLDTKGVNDSDIYSIMNAAPNASREDYILNFDYLKDTGAITQEQYDAIKPYEKKMREYNDELARLQGNLSAYQTEQPKVEAQKKIYENSIDLDTEQISQNTALANALDAKDGALDGYISLSANNPDVLIVVDGVINLRNTNKGIKVSSIKLYDNYDALNKTLSTEITSYITKIEDGNLVELQGVTSVDNKIYATYDYNPQLYYSSIVAMWQQKLNNDTAALAEQTALLTELETNITTVEARIAELSKGSSSLMFIARREFEELMGPALREGYWQPEDYIDYGDTYTITKNLNNLDDNLTSDTGTGVHIGWDTTLFDGEDKAYYLDGTLSTHKNYVCINLNTVFPNGIPTNIDAYSLVFNSNYVNADDEPAAIRHLTYYAVGSQLQLGYVKRSSTLIPVLILLDSKNMSDTEITHMKNSSKGRARLATVGVTSGLINGTETNVVSIDNSAWVTYGSDLLMAYPRLKFSSTALKTDSSNLVIWYGSQELKQYQDYYINMRNTNIGTVISPKYQMEYFITLKPELLFKYGATQDIFIGYVLSNASTAIYLDAKKVSIENAYPKVSYEVDVNILQESLSKILFNKLAQIVSINDTELKLENVFGYISQIELDLDNVQNDKIEVKNYKNKFEDVFSSILAATEAMKYNSYSYDKAAAGKVGLKEDSFIETLDDNKEKLDEYLDEYFNSSSVVQERLASLFNEAGEIIASGDQALGRLGKLTEENANILSGFIQNVADDLSGRVFRQSGRPLVFKIGDIWIKSENERYVAVSNSKDLIDNTGTNGFVRTYNGKFASVTGAKLDVNADTGTIDILAANSINMGAQTGNVDITAGMDVNITGNRAVNIGGTQINIGSASIDSTTVWGGINLVAAAYDSVGSSTNSTSLSKILISPTKLELGSSNILMRGANKIQMIASRGASSDTSAIEISADDGVWIGSGKGVRLFSGSVTTDDSGSITYKDGNTTLTANGASVELNSEHLILGYADRYSSTSGSVMEFTKEFIVIGIGSTTNSANITGVSGGLVGAKLTKNSIGLAVTSGVTTNAVLINNLGVTIGSGVNVTDTTANLNTAVQTAGSYVRIAPTGVYIGSTGELEINTSNFLIDSNATGTNNMFALRNGSTNYLTYSLTNGLQIFGSNGKLKATGSTFGFYDLNDNAILTISSSSLVVGSNYTLSVGGNLSINSTNLVVDPNATGTSVLFKAVNGNNGITVLGNGTTTVTGTINATGGEFSGDITATGSITGASIYGGNIEITGSGNHAGSVTIGGSTNVITFTNGSLTVQGDITCNTLTVGTNGSYMSYSSSGGLTIGGSTNLLSFNGSTLSIQGDITCNSLTVGSNGSYMSYSSSGGLNIGNGGLTYDGSAFTVIGAIHATALYITDNNVEQSATDWVNAKVTPEAIWLGVTNRTSSSYSGSGSATSIHLTDNSISVDSTGSIILNGASLTLNSGGTSVISMTTGGITLASGSITLDGASLTLISGVSNVIQLTTSGITLTGQNLSLNGGSITFTSSGATVSISGTSVAIGAGTLSVNTNGLMLNSAATGSGLVIQCGTSDSSKFTVDADGNVTIHSLMVDGQSINFSTFNQAVSYTGGSWSGNTQSATFTANIKLWGKINKSIDISTSITASANLTLTGNTAQGNTNVLEVTGNIISDMGSTTSHTVPFTAYVNCHDPLQAKYTEGETYGKQAAWYEAYQLHNYWQTDTVSLNYSESVSVTLPSSSYNNSITITFQAPANNASSGSGNSSESGGGNSSEGGGGCFAAGTLVRLADNSLIPIEELGLGMSVLAYNEKDKVFVPSEIQLLQVIRNRKQRVMELHLSSSKIIIATAEHPFLTTNGWSAIDTKKAIEIYGIGSRLLQIGDELISPDGNVYLDNIVERPDLSDITVYHMDVEPFDTYIVEGVVVHNDDNTGGK